MSTHQKKGSAKKDWMLAISSGMAGALLSSFIMWFTSYKNLISIEKVEKTRLMTELRREFYDSASVYSEIHLEMSKMDVDGETCLALYDGWENKNLKKGKFNHSEIGQYLTFFENLGYFVENDILDIDIVNEFFGPSISEAYHRKEFQVYINKVRKKLKSNEPYVLFENLANHEKLKNSPHYNYFKNQDCWKDAP